MEPEEEIRTLFLSGLPMDVKEREIHNLFRFFPGYEGCVMQYTNNQVVAFARWTDKPSALAARDYLQGLRFDPESSVTMRIELAKSNSKAKREEPFKGRGPAKLSSNNYNDFLSNYPPRQKPPPRIQPCSTLFVANLGHSVGEEEITHLFSSLPGFKRLKFYDKDDGAVCFVEFQDIHYSSNCMSKLNGYLLRPSLPLHIAFAKNKMGESRRRRDGPGAVSYTHLTLPTKRIV
eukprot:TRINITY_DN1826_c0_g1_i3.p1 TRINITY_DN1826_c0_g1~~TRINITY_DN1826_c0_g1_i3.p1  ORF type:complete len:233 (-),score=44.46 TRINITY_DN1826_c0_g1_i3:4-702(-)